MTRTEASLGRFSGSYGVAVQVGQLGDLGGPQFEGEELHQLSGIWPLRFWYAWRNGFSLS